MRSVWRLGKRTFTLVVQWLSRVQLFVTPWTAAYQALLSTTTSRSLLKFISIELLMLSNNLILCSPLLLLPSIFPSIRVFSNELAHWSNRWLKSWSFSFSIHSSIDSALTSFTIDWFDLLKVQGTLKGFVQHHDFYSHWQTKQRAKLSNDGENKVGGIGSWSIKLLKLPTLFIAATVGTVWLPHDPGRNQAPFES